MNHHQQTLSTQASSSFPCNECAAGVMHVRLITYFTWLAEELITVPNFPAWICDMCGRREYDEHAIAWLTMFLDPNAGKSTPRVKRKPQTGNAKQNFPQLPLD
jgi:YgiT-type zinc finger domain-containing protein